MYIEISLTDKVNNKTKEDFSGETRPWLIRLKSLRKMLKIRLAEGYMDYDVQKLQKVCSDF